MKVQVGNLKTLDVFQGWRKLWEGRGGGREVQPASRVLGLKCCVGQRLQEQQGADLLGVGF